MRYILKSLSHQYEAYTVKIPKSSKMNKLRGQRHLTGKATNGAMNVMRAENFNQLMPPQAKADMLSVLSFMESLGDELENSSELLVPAVRPMQRPIAALRTCKKQA